MDILAKWVDYYKKHSQKSFINKYTLTVLAFVVWLSLFDKYSFSTQYELSQTVNELQNQKTNYQKQLEEAIVERKTMNNDIEKYGREKYLFHREGEEIILIK